MSVPSENKMAIRSGYAAKRPTPDEFLATARECNRASVNFLKTDVETGLTFSTIAMQSKDKSKRNRMRQNARKAYDTVLRLMRRVELTPPDARFLARNLKRLRADLIRLGEKFS